MNLITTQLLLLPILSYTSRDNNEIEKDTNIFNSQRENIREERQEGKVTGTFKPNKLGNGRVKTRNKHVHKSRKCRLMT